MTKANLIVALVASLLVVAVAAFGFNLGRGGSSSAEQAQKVSFIVEIETAITAEANDIEFLDPVIKTVCLTLEGGSVKELPDESATKLECMAVTDETSDGKRNGYLYDATVNWDEGSYTAKMQR